MKNPTRIYNNFRIVIIITVIYLFIYLSAYSASRCTLFSHTRLFCKRNFFLFYCLNIQNIGKQQQQQQKEISFKLVLNIETMLLFPRSIREKKIRIEITAQIDIRKGQTKLCMEQMKFVYRFEARVPSATTHFDSHKVTSNT